MGVCGSKEEEAARAVNDKINKDLKKQKKVLDNELRLLLLGKGRLTMQNVSP